MRIPKKIDPKYKDHLRTLERDGIIVLPNFFPEDAYRKLKDEYMRLVPQFTLDHSPILLPHVEGMVIHDERVSPFFRSAFCDNTLIHALVTAYLNRRYYLPLKANLAKIYCSTEEEMRSPQNGGTNNLHFDTPARTMKAFYYVTDTNRQNAALKYCIGTNKRNTLKRLWLEYKLSIRYTLNKGNNNHGGEYADDEPWVVLTEKEKHDNGLVETDMEVKGNTLIIVDTGGFHRRGEFHSTIPRETVEINWRSIDTLRNALFPLERLLRRKTQGKERGI